jgi:hypothetical protein
LNKILSVLSICLVAAVITLVSACTADTPPTFSTPFQAVLLDNGQVYYGKVSKLGTSFPVMTDVYYIVNTEDKDTKAVKHVLVKRGKELHAPTETILAARHIIMIEPVGPDSEVGQLIVKAETQGSLPPPPPPSTPPSTSQQQK